MKPKVKNILQVVGISCIVSGISVGATYGVCWSGQQDLEEVYQVASEYVGSTQASSGMAQNEIEKLREQVMELEQAQQNSVSQGYVMEITKEYESKISELQQELDSKTTESEQLYNTLNDTEIALINKQKEYNDLFEQHENSQRQSNTQIEELEQRIRELEDEILMYQNQSSSSSGEMAQANQDVKEFKEKMLLLFN